MEKLDCAFAQFFSCSHRVRIVQERSDFQGPHCSSAINNDSTYSNFSDDPYFEVGVLEG